MPCINRVTLRHRGSFSPFLCFTCAKMPDVKFTILVTFKCTAQWRHVHAHRCATLAPSIPEVFHLARLKLGVPTGGGGAGGAATWALR